MKDQPAPIVCTCDDCRPREPMTRLDYVILIGGTLAIYVPILVWIFGGAS